MYPVIEVTTAVSMLLVLMVINMKVMLFSGLDVRLLLSFFFLLPHLGEYWFHEQIVTLHLLAGKIEVILSFLWAVVVQLAH